MQHGHTHSDHSSKTSRAVTFVALACMIGTLSGCGGEGGGPLAQLSAVESAHVPGRIELDGSSSFSTGNRKLVSYTYTVKNQETGETVYGPVTFKTGQGPLKIYPYANTATATSVKDVTGTYKASLTVEDDQGQTHTATSALSLKAAVSYAVDPCDATCSLESGGSGQVVCALSTSCNQAILWTNLTTRANALNTAIGINTTMWIQAFGASGGDGTDQVFGGDSGAGGKGGFAQTITTSNVLANATGSGILYYYLGQAGSHDDSGGSGGGSTIVTSFEPSGSLPHNQIILIAGGGGGGGEGSADYSGAQRGGGGADGGYAYSDQVGQTATGAGGNAWDDSFYTPAFTVSGEGGGGTGCAEGVACGGAGYHAGYQGFGGASGGSGSESSKGWINGGPDLAVNAGKGADGGNPNSCGGGGGGGGYGGGGSGSIWGTLSSGADEYRCYGGGGGGSFAMASTTTDGNAPSSYIANNGNGEVLVTFDPNPS